MYRFNMTRRATHYNLSRNTEFRNFYIKQIHRLQSAISPSFQYETRNWSLLKRCHTSCPVHLYNHANWHLLYQTISFSFFNPHGILVIVKQTSQLSPLGTLLVDSLHRIDTFEASVNASRSRDTMQVNTVGSKLTVAYEQLRNASEYTEGNLLRQRAIRRYFVRTLSFYEKSETKHLADELIIELTQAEYIPNHSFTNQDVKTIASHIKQYYRAYWQYRKIEPNNEKRRLFQGWMLDTLSVRCEQVLQNNVRQILYTHLAFTYLQPQLDIARILQPNDVIDPEDYPILLYIAIQKTLLKLDLPTIRANLLESYRRDVTSLHHFEGFNTKLDYLFDTKTLAMTARLINKNGATLRMIHSGFYSSNGSLTQKDLSSPDTLSYALTKHVEREYTLVNKLLDNGIVKSIIFLLVTKSIIGLAIEVPYDLAVAGHIAWLPLIINLLFPAVFIIFSRMTLSTPGVRNTEAIATQASSMLFAETATPEPIKISRKSTPVGFTAAYGVMFIVAFAALSYILHLLQFNIVQGIIFFIFLSTASFLSFRLSNQIREIEAVTLAQGSLSLMRDILYLPFIYVGQQISFRYAKINILATILDFIIELPLKTVLRLLRQWTNFLSSKKDDLI